MEGGAAELGGFPVRHALDARALLTTGAWWYATLLMSAPMPMPAPPRALAAGGAAAGASS